ncbi:hypothetical protein F2P81_012071 [Scophthalmus maximus]|uniref:Uncharacterized protein n=1 Tax=Scophthalmus maximus TaxID=52904 RepID=A0A6A4SVR1_SCOMX|nr:hypothetical protein F2P81_012071 [Scophthalmus maximus]
MPPTISAQRLAKPENYNTAQGTSLQIKTSPRKRPVNSDPVVGVADFHYQLICDDETQEKKWRTIQPKYDMETGRKTDHVKFQQTFICEFYDKQEAFIISCFASYIGRRNKKSPTPL